MLTHSFTFLTLSAAVIAQNPSEDCWYDALCEYDPMDPDKVAIEDADTMTMMEKMTYCQTLCFNNPDCEHFSVHTLSRGTNCYQLASCSARTTDTCVPELCNSGPKNCDTNNNCPALAPYVDAAANKIPWQCDNINPYTNQVPEGKSCFLACSAWVDADTGESAVIKSVCEEGAYQPSEISDPSLNIAAMPALLPQPDDDEASQVSCGCAPYDMAWDDGAGGEIDYNPNTLLGTAFICDDDFIDTTDADNHKFILTPANTCRLFCDSYHVATMTCEGGKWTGEPELGAWCYYEPVAEDDMNNSPPVTQPTIKTVPQL